MRTTNQKEAVASHAGSTIALNNALAEHISIAENTSIARAIAQAFGDNTTPPQPGSFGSILPSPFHNPDLGNLAHFADAGSTDPSHGTSQADPLNGIAADVAAAMARLVGMDLSTDSDPTHKAGINIGSGLPSADALKAVLAQDGVIVNTTSGDPSKGDGQAAGSGLGHLQRPDGPPSGSPMGSDVGHNMLGDMLSDKFVSETGNKTEKTKDYTDGSGDQHHRVTEIYGDGTKIVYDKDKTTGVEILGQRTSEGDTITTYDPNTGTTKVETHDKATNHDRTVVVDANGKIVQDSDHPKASGTSIPDGDNQSALPSWLANQIHNEISHAMKTEHPGNSDGDTINVRNDGPDTASAGELTSKHADWKGTLLGGDNTYEGTQGSGGAGNAPNVNYNGTAGAIDPGPESDTPSQANGPMPHDHQHVIATNPAGSHASGGQQGNGEGQGGSHGLLPVNHLVAATTQDLVKAYEASHSGDHKTAQSVGADHTSHDIASLLAGATAPHDSHDDFAALIHFASNPQQLGLVATAAGRGADVSLLSMHDAVGHLSEAHVDVTHVAAPSVFDDHHIGLPTLEAFHALHQ